MRRHLSQLAAQGVFKANAHSCGGATKYKWWNGILWLLLTFNVHVIQLTLHTTLTQPFHSPPSMYITRSVSQKLTFAAASKINLNFEADGTCCITMPSLTGEGTHTKWYYIESMALRKKQRYATTVRSNPTEQHKTSVGRPSVGFEESLRSTSTHGIKPASQSVHTFEHGHDELDLDVRSDATELVDEEAEREAWLKSSREESLPDLPYEHLMRRISQEPTLIDDEDTS